MSSKNAILPQWLLWKLLEFENYVGHLKSFDVCYETINLEERFIANSFHSAVLKISFIYLSYFQKYLTC